MATTPTDPRRAAAEQRSLPLELDSETAAPARTAGAAGTAAAGAAAAGTAGASGTVGTVGTAEPRGTNGAGASASRLGDGRSGDGRTGMGDGPDERRAQPVEPRAKRDLLREFGNLHPAERILGLGALAALLGFLVANLWGDVFSNWFYALTLVGAAGTAALLAAQMLEVRPLEPRSRGVLLLGFALAPALGFVIETLSNTWTALMLIGAAMMAYAAVRLILDSPPDRSDRSDRSGRA